MVVDRYGLASADFSKQVQDKNLATAAASKTSGSSPNKSAAEDTTSFTSATHTVQTLSRTAIQPVPSRQLRVEALRQAVSSAQYKLDSAKVAQALANFDF